MSNWKLLIEDDAGKTIVVPVSRDVITIGRKDGNTIRLTERNVSRFHAKLIRESGTVFIEDLASYNGVKLNGDRIKGKVEIQEGDLIEIGDYHLALQNEGIDALPTQPPMEPTAKLAPASGPQPPAPLDGDTTHDAYPDDDQFAGDTQRWEPPASMEPVAVGGPTMSDQAPLGLGADIPTTDDTVPLPAQPALLSDADGPPESDATIRNPSAPHMAAPGMVGAPTESGLTEPFSPPPSGSDEASGDFLPPPGDLGPGSPFALPSDETQPHLPPSEEGPPRNGASAPAMARPATPPSSPAAPVSKPPVPSRLPSAGGFPGGLDDDPDQTAAVPRAAPDPTQMPRLVAVNTVFAGSVFPLRLDEIIIGRVEDNDLVIEHRSVSRSHAKLVKEPGGYHIVDLKSANGVLVNGEEVGKAKLHSGDIIELGRVRLRFVPAGEPFTLSEAEIQKARIADAQGEDFGEDSATAIRGRFEPTAAPSAGGGSPNTMLLVAFGAIIVLLVIVIVILLSRDPRGGEVTGARVEQPAVPVTASMTEEEIEATKRENEGLFTEAKAMWEDMQADGNQGATAAIARLDTKIADQNRAKELERLVADAQWDDVIEVASHFATDSPYAPQVDKAVMQAKRGKADALAAEAEAALQAKRYADAEKAITALSGMETADGRDVALAKTLEAARAEVQAAAEREAEKARAQREREERSTATASKGRSRSERPSSGVKRSSRTSNKTSEPDRAAAEAALSDATMKWAHGKNEAALRKAQQARRADPSFNEVNLRLGQINVSLGRHGKAVEAYRRYLKNGGKNDPAIAKYLREHGG